MRDGMVRNGWRYGLVEADHYRPIEEQSLIQPLLTIPLVMHWRFNTKHYGNSRF
jgi:hypothetical protein